jgi:hypothetical protein
MKNEAYRQAEDTFFSHRGRISYSELAKLFGVTKRTVTRWAVKHDWQKRVAELAEQVNKKVTEKLSDDLATRAVELIRDSMAPLQKATQIITKQLTDAPDIDPNRPLTPSDLRALTLAQSDIVRTSRLLSGQSTENLSQRSTIEANLNHGGEDPGFLDDAIQRVIRTGNIEGQLLLCEIQEKLQRLLDVTGGQ